MDINNPLSLAALNTRLDSLQRTLAKVEDTASTIYSLLNIILTNQKTLLLQNAMLGGNAELVLKSAMLKEDGHFLPEYYDITAHDKESECI